MTTRLHQQMSALLGFRQRAFSHCFCISSSKPLDSVTCAGAPAASAEANFCPGPVGGTGSKSLGYAVPTGVGSPLWRGWCSADFQESLEHRRWACWCCMILCPDIQAVWEITTVKACVSTVWVCRGTVGRSLVSSQVRMTCGCRSCRQWCSGAEH